MFAKASMWPIKKAVTIARATFRIFNTTITWSLSYSLDWADPLSDYIPDGLHQALLHAKKPSV
jgi:hypothetical protein